MKTTTEAIIEALRTQASADACSDPMEFDPIVSTYYVTATKTWMASAHEPESGIKHSTVGHATEEKALARLLLRALAADPSWQRRVLERETRIETSRLKNAQARAFLASSKSRLAEPEERPEAFTAPLDALLPRSLLN